MCRLLSRSAVRIDSKGQFVASPSLVKLPNGRLLAALERCACCPRGCLRPLLPCTCNALCRAALTMPATLLCWPCRGTSRCACPLSLLLPPAGRRSVSWGVTQETTMKLIYSSNDGGASWQRTALVGPMNWPQVGLACCCCWWPAAPSVVPPRAAAACQLQAGQ